MNLVDSGPRTISDPDTVVGPLGFGCWRMEPGNDNRALIETALDCGINLVDTADIYGYSGDGTGFGDAERVLGDVFAAEPSLRDRVVLATKGGITPPVPYDSSPAYLRSACEASLRRLHTDVIDVYMVHRPDVLTHPESVAATLTELRDSGKIRHVGVSNYTSEQYRALTSHLDFPIAVTQPEYSVAHLDPIRDGTFDTAMGDGVTPLAWSPLGGGTVIAADPTTDSLAATLDRLAAREGVDRAAIALAFVLAHPSRPVAILGTQRPERVRAALDALGVSLDRNDCYDLIEASDGVPLP
jgi:predicted oxidoreductase